jgi:expansin (peptidoglycan-binding protein)
MVLAVNMVQTAPILVSRGSWSGEGTFYDVGHGSCGTTNNDNEMVAAISILLMNGNSYCGKSISVKGKNGSSVSLKVVDTCPGCAEGDIDMSRAAFSKLTKLSDGRVPITWSFE